LSRLPRYRATEPSQINLSPTSSSVTEGSDHNVNQPDAPTPSPPRRTLAALFWVAFFLLAARDFYIRLATDGFGDVIRDMLSFWMLPALVAVFLLYGWVRRVRVYESLVEGAKEGFQVALRIIPFLVAILVVIGMFRASGGLDLIIGLIAPVTHIFGMPAEALPMALLRPLSGSGALAVASETMNTHGPDSLVGYMVSTYQGSTETTFYTLAVYFGAIGVKETRHTVPACLLADITGILAATFIINLLFG